MGGAWENGETWGMEEGIEGDGLNTLGTTTSIESTSNAFLIPSPLNTSSRPNIILSQPVGFYAFMKCIPKPRSCTSITASVPPTVFAPPKPLLNTPIPSPTHATLAT